MNEVRELTEMEVEAVVGGGLFDGGGFNINFNPVNNSPGGNATRNGNGNGNATGGNGGSQTFGPISF